MGRKRQTIAEDLRKAVIYARYSSHMQREESIDAQVRAIKKYAADNGYFIIGEYLDSAKSGTNADRDGFQRMLKDSKKRQFQYVIVHKLDRFSRDRYDSALAKRELKINCVRVISVVENLDDSPESLMMEGIVETFAAFYSANLAREVKKGLAENAYKGMHTGGFPPLGFDVCPDTKMYSINETEAETIRLIFNMYINGRGYKKILQHLNAMGYRTKFGNTFGSNSLHTILKNEKYMGTFVYQKKTEKGADGKRRPHYNPENQVIRVEDVLPAIIDKATFEKAQDILANNTAHGGKHKAKEIYLISGLAFCGYCGSALYGNSRWGGRGRKTHYTGYRCSGEAQNKGCDVKEVQRRVMESFVLDILYKNLFTDETIAKSAKKLTEYYNNINDSNQSELAACQERLTVVNGEIEKILDLITKSGVSIQTVESRIKELEANKNYLEEHIREINASKAHQMTEDTIRQMIELSKDFIRSKNVSECRIFMETFISKVLLYRDRVEVVYKINVPTEDGQGLIPLVSSESIVELKKLYL